MIASTHIPASKLPSAKAQPLGGIGLKEKGAFLEPPYRPAPTRVDPSSHLTLDVARSGIRAILWATGFRPDNSWLEVLELDRRGRLRHDGGIVPSPGMYVLGLQFLRRRKSALIDGAGDDARDLPAHPAAYLHGQITEAAA